jgi:hypothetical protein
VLPDETRLPMNGLAPSDLPVNWWSVLKAPVARLML